MRLLNPALSLVLALAASVPVLAADGNRLTYLDESDPYYVSRTFPKLITPQWVGEEGVEAVVILAIDDMNGPDKWEKFLRPILQRLKRIDGRAPVSIMTNKIDPKHPHLQTWLKEGLSLETHTYDHPCPLFKENNVAKAKTTYERCVDLLAEVPNSKPVAFRMPCCDSLNTVSPRFYAEIFNKTTAKGNFLAIDSSVFNVFTSNDPDLPRDLVIDPDGRDKFLKYLPADRTFVNTIENYPYPYVIGKLCWQFPCVTPSDWAAQHRHGSNNPQTVADWKAALDATVIKQGVFCLVFHPHGWIRNEQVIDLIDHAVSKHGKKVKFLTFKEALERINKNLLKGESLRVWDWDDNGIRLLDLNNDGYLDVVIGGGRKGETRVWSPEKRAWLDSEFPPVPLTIGGCFPGCEPRDMGVRFGVLRPDGFASFLSPGDKEPEFWHFDGTRWVEDKTFLKGLENADEPGKNIFRVGEPGVRLRDLNNDGRCEIIVSYPPSQVGEKAFQAIFAWSPEKRAWEKLPFNLPAGTSLANTEGWHQGLRFVDLDGNGYDDVIFSNENHYSVHLFTSMKDGWSRKVRAGKRTDPDAIPMIARKGTNNGAWFHSRHLIVQNEDTASQKDLIDRRSFNELVEGVEPNAKAPQAALRSIQTRPGFKVELMAAEPLVLDPIAMAWGLDGKLWVVEMGDYPLGADGKGKPGGRVLFLEDTDGDGKYDKATVFLDHIGFPTGVLPWKKGVLVTCAPDIFYAQDTDGDGKADKREVLYTGFIEGNQQHRVNGLVWGLDNWIYCANGDSGGQIKSIKTGKVVDIRGRDLRIRPDTGDLEAQSGQTQYGRNPDDWGNWFGGNNSNPMWHYVLDDHYLRRNPHIAAPETRVTVPAIPGAAPVFPLSRTLPRFNDPHAANRFTSACSPIVYRDDLFGPHFANNTFVSEPVHNLVHREIMTADGVTFKSRRAVDEQQSEFLASSDNWFRPTMIRTGPDGALWIADMYRQVIEHPQWIPPDWQKRLDLRAGHDQGRIYRVYPVGTTPRPIPCLECLDTAELVAALDSPSGWQRDVVQQMLVEQKDKATIPLLEKLARECQRPLGRLHALCTLDGMGALSAALVQRALDDPHPGVRRHAIRLCEGRLGQSGELGTALVKRVADSDPQVRLQLAYTLGEWDDPQAGRALGQLALQEAGNRYLVAAVLSSVTAKNFEPLVRTVLATKPNTPPPAALVEGFLRLATVKGNTNSLIPLLRLMAAPVEGRYTSWQFGTLAGLLDTLDQQSRSLAQLAQEGGADAQAIVRSLSSLFDQARTLVPDTKAPHADRLAAVRILGRGPDHRQEDITLLASLLTPRTADDLQAAAIATLGRLRDRRVPEDLLGGWKGYTPALRSQALDVLLGRDDWTKAVLHALEQKQVLPSEVDAARRQRLVDNKNVGVRDRAAKLFGDTINPDRQKVIEGYRSALTLKGDARQGLQVFSKTCAACHRLGEVGQAVGPDLAALSDKSPDYLLTNILDPNRAVEARYINYLAVTKSGLTKTGFLASETSTGITLVGPDGKPQPILRIDLEELASTGKSAMPEGLEKDLKPQDFADLIAYLRGAIPTPKRKVFEGNQPAVVRPAADGSLRLLASNCEIYGSGLVLEKQHGNLGYWSNQDDHAVWSVDVPQDGKYAVWLDWACDNNSSGNTLVMQAGLSRLTYKVAGTGTGDTYRQAKIGEIALRAGPQQVVMRSVGKITGAMIDLKGVRLMPLARE